MLLAVRISCWGVSIFLCLASPLGAQEQNASPTHIIYLDMLEDDRQELANSKPDRDENRIVRAAFQKTESGWATISPSLDRAVTWTIAFNGRTLGEVGRRPYPGAADSTIDSGLQTVILRGRNLPTVRVPSDQFADLRAVWGTKVRRPLVVVSAPNFRDPDGWKRSIPSEKIVTLARRAYRRDFPYVYKYDEEHPSQTDRRFPNSDIELNRVYVSN